MANGKGCWRRSIGMLNWPLAAQHWSAALRRGPPDVNPEAYRTLCSRGACYMHMGPAYWEAACKDFDEAIRLRPDFWCGWNCKDAMQLMQSDFLGQWRPSRRGSSTALETSKFCSAWRESTLQSICSSRACIGQVSRCRPSWAAQAEGSRRQNRSEHLQCNVPHGGSETRSRISL